MNIFPAIDLIDGKAVRLFKGDYDKMTVYNDNPLNVAKEFESRENKTGTNSPTFQFMRVGFFCMDNRDSTPDHLVFNRSVLLKDGFKK